MNALRTHNSNNLRDSVRALAGLVVVVGLWEFASLYSQNPLVPPPHKIAQAWWDLLADGKLVPATTASIWRVLVGFGVASLAALVLATLLGRFPLLMTTARPVIEILRPISPLAWIPIAIAAFGIGNRAAYFIVFIGSFFPILLNAIAGIHSVSIRHVEAARSLGADRWLSLHDVIWPSAKPYILTGLRIGLGVGWMSLIAAELISAELGLGYLIQVNRVGQKMENVVAVMITIGVIGFVMNHGLLWYARRTMPWWRAQSPL